jgi:hypothetical protein
MNAEDSRETIARLIEICIRGGEHIPVDIVYDAVTLGVDVSEIEARVILEREEENHIHG